MGAWGRLQLLRPVSAWSSQGLRLGAWGPALCAAPRLGPVLLMGSAMPRIFFMSKGARKAKGLPTTCKFSRSLGTKEALGVRALRCAPESAHCCCPPYCSRWLQEHR